MKLIDADALFVELNNKNIPYRRDIGKIIREMTVYAPIININKPQWIPFKLEYDEDYRCEMLQGELPEDGQGILVSDGIVTREDMFIRDGFECYLESGIGICDGAIAWMPLPEPYESDEEKMEE